MKNKRFSFAIGTVVVFLLAGGIYAAGSRSWMPTGAFGADASSSKIKVTVYKSPSCGCCSNYVAYLKRNGYDVDTINQNDLTSIKDQYHIDPSMESCHTTVMGDYFSEGHIPVEAIERFMEDPGALAGIAMPGMPSGSPGMPGGKTGPFVIRGIASDGTISDYISM